MERAILIFCLDPDVLDIGVEEAIFKVFSLNVYLEEEMGPERGFDETYIL